jgi:hypothetical protein
MYNENFKCQYRTIYRHLLFQKNKETMNAAQVGKSVFLRVVSGCECEGLAIDSLGRSARSTVNYL